MKLSTGLIIDNIYTSLFIPLEKIVNYIEQSGKISELIFVRQSFTMFMQHILIKRSLMI